MNTTEIENTLNYMAANRPADARIEPSSSWPCNDCGADYKAGLPIWREVDASFYEAMRDCVPPECLGQGLPGFMVGEPYTHDEAGAVHLALVHAPKEGRFFARYLPRRAVRVPVAALFAVIRA